jgi:hypothetical protein
VYKQTLRRVKLTTGKKGKKTELTGKGPFRRRRSALDCSATEEEDYSLMIYVNHYICCLFLSTHNINLVPERKSMVENIKKQQMSVNIFLYMYIFFYFWSCQLLKRVMYKRKYIHISYQL